MQIKIAAFGLLTAAFLILAVPHNSPSPNQTELNKHNVLEILDEAHRGLKNKRLRRRRSLLDKETSNSNETTTTEKPIDFRLDVISRPLDVLFIIDRYSSIEVDFIETKCLLHNLTSHFDVAYYKKVRLALMTLDKNKKLEFSFRRYQDSYGYNRAIEMLSSSTEENHIERALTYARESVLQPKGGQAARENVAKVVIVILGSPSNSSIREAAYKLRSEPYVVTIAIGHNNAIQKELYEIAGDASGVIFSDRTESLCKIWTDVYRSMLLRLEVLYGKALDPLKGFHISMSSEDMIEVSWERPADLVDYYIIRYRPSRIGPQSSYRNVSVNVGREKNVQLHGLESTEYLIQVTAYGIKQTSPTYSLTVDMTCSGIKLDLVLVFDTSILTEDSFDSVRHNFIYTFINSFMIDYKSTRVGIILYAEESRYVAPLSTYTEKNELLWRINELDHDVGVRNTGAALKFAYFYGFEYARRDVVKMVVVVTNGKSNDNVSRATKKLHNDDTLIFHIGVDGDVSEEEREVYASKPLEEFYYPISSFNELPSLQINLLKSICSQTFKYYNLLTPSLVAPKNFQANDVSNTSFVINWEDEKTDLVTNFEIFNNATNITFLVGKHYRTFTFYDLLPGHYYNISINSKGYRKRSAKVFLSVKTDIPAAFGVTVQQLERYKIRIRWQTPSDEVLRYKISIFFQKSKKLFMSIYTTNLTSHMISANTTHILNSTEIMFGTRYKVQVRCIYQDDYESEPAIAHLITELPAPEDFQVAQRLETRVQLIWKRLNFKQHSTEHFMYYPIKIYDEYGNIIFTDKLNHNSSSPFSREKNYDNYLYIWIANLIPGRKYKATVEVQLHEEISEIVMIKFNTKTVGLPIDIAILVEVSPTLQRQEVVATRNFIRNYITSFEIEDPENVRITMMQLSDLPSKKFSMNDSTNRTFLMNQLDNLLPMPGSSVLSQEKFMFTLKAAFEHARSGIPRIMLLLMTNQHYTNLMPELDHELSDKGITSIIVQMAEKTKSPFSNQAIMHRYILGEFHQLYYVVHFVVTDTVRAEMFPLERIKQERELIPSSLTISKRLSGGGVLEWWAPNQWPDYYIIQLNGESGTIWRENTTLPRRLQYTFPFSDGLNSESNYTMILEAFTKDLVSAKRSITFRTDKQTKLVLKDTTYYEEAVLQSLIGYTSKGIDEKYFSRGRSYEQDTSEIRDNKHIIEISTSW